MRSNKGITLISLTAMVIILLLITSMIIYSSKNEATVKKLDNLYVDIDLIQSRVNDYYLTYGTLPVLCKYLGKTELTELIQLNADSKSASLSYDNIVNPNDDDVYYVINLEKLEGLSLNYGYDDEYETIKQNKTYTTSDVEDEIYVINNCTHQIYFPHGIFLDGVMYYTTEVEEEVSIEQPTRTN